MANITLSIDEKLLRKGRDYASSRGKSLNALVRDLLTDLTSSSEAEVTAMISRLRSSSGDSKGMSFKRE